MDVTADTGAKAPISDPRYYCQRGPRLFSQSVVRITFQEKSSNKFAINLRASSFTSRPSRWIANQRKNSENGFGRQGSKSLLEEVDSDRIKLVKS